GIDPEPIQLNHFVDVISGCLRASHPSNEKLPPPVKNNVNPVANPNTPICHSSRQVVPIHPAPSKMPIAKPKTPMLIRRVNSPKIMKSPTMASTMVKLTNDHQSHSGFETINSIMGFIPSALGRK